MSDREALLAAIRANPDDDLPRHLYADWLEENGSSLPAIDRASAGDRAAFIRFQLEAARAEPYTAAARAAELSASSLLDMAKNDVWTWHLIGLMLDVGFERGFIERVNVDAEKFPDDAAALFELEPIRSIRAVRPIPSRSEYEVPLAPYFDVSQLQNIHSLDLQNVELSYDDCVNLANSPYLTGLAHLSLRGNPIFPPWFREFVSGPLWPNLSSLDLSDISNLGPAIAKGFREADHRRFAKLDLSGVSFRSDDLKQTLGSACVSELEELRLRWNGGSAMPGSLTHLELGWVIPWDRLRLLDLEGQGIGPEGVREIVRHEQATNLRWLNLARNYLGSDGVRLLVEKSRLNLFYLDVRHNDLGPKDEAALQQRFPEAMIVI